MPDPQATRTLFSSRRLLAFIVAAAASVPCAFAQDLPQRINDSGQTRCYAGAGDGLITTTPCTDPDWPGQDGAGGRDAAAASGSLVKIGAGAAGFDFSKISNAGAELPASAALGTAPAAWGCTRDNTTGLLWRASTLAATSWMGARTAALAANAGPGLCGQRDWRVPAGRELQDLAHYGVSSPAIDGSYFPDTASGFQWSADGDSSAPGQRARIVNFSGGFVNPIAANSVAEVRLVRGGGWFGAPIDNGNGTVSDARTGLMWDRCALGQETATDCGGAGSTLRWQAALQIVQQRNAQNWRGHNDWRLPNVKELVSLIDPARHRPAIDGAFPNTASAAYWSSTTSARSIRTVWSVFFGEGLVFAKDKSTVARVRLVRSGTAAVAGSALNALFADGFDNAPAAAPIEAVAQIALTTAGGAPITKENDVAGTVTITSSNPAYAYEGTMQIKGRGNSTWDMPKKPYRMKLDSKAPLLGMPKSKHWVLLANYADKTLLRTSIAMTIGERMQMAWSPRSRMAEVTLNGAYLGTYQLMEKIRVDPGRVNIAEMGPNDIALPAVSGGYLMEIDGRRNCAANVQFDTARGVPFCIETPADDEIVAPQYAYIKNYIQQTEDAIWSPDFANPATGYAAFLDADSFIDWYLVNELTANVDSASATSIWNYKDRGGKLKRGPLWDFDLALGNADYLSCADPEGFWVRQGTWYNRLFLDPVFASAVRARWDALKASQFDTLSPLIDASAAALGDAAAHNFQRWPILDTWAWPNVVVTGSHEGDVAYIKDWLEQRIIWLDANL